jgi:hypothetical protein
LLDITYILPLRRDGLRPCAELTAYLLPLSRHVQVVVVDGSPPGVFAAHAQAWTDPILHIPVDPDLRTPNGKVGGVLTGLRHARYERVVIADDDVRYDLPSLRRMAALLDRYAVVRPQNYFGRLPWHARLDTARTLLNRVTGGDWPGTLGVRRSYLEATGGYDGAVLFENLELIRTVKAAGGEEIVPLDLYVRRGPPDARHFLSQRVRQAYDELARPARLAVSLALLPAALFLLRGGHRGSLALGALTAIAAAEAGRRRGNGRAVFPAHCSLLAPLWLLERAVCIWLAVLARLVLGGVPYRGAVLRRAATPMRVLRRRHAGARLPGAVAA